MSKHLKWKLFLSGIVGLLFFVTDTVAQERSANSVGGGARRRSPEL
jgi:hypothetical protein